MKKTLVCLLIGLLTLTAFTACKGDSEQTTDGTTAATTTAVTTTDDSGDDQVPDHVHAAGEAWLVDKDNHWHICECGEVMDSAAHTVEDDICTGCDTELYVFDDGTVSLSQYNENGDCLLAIDYDEDGKETGRQIGEYTYDEDGNMLTALLTFYDGDANVEYTNKFEYTYDEDGNPLTEKHYIDDALTYECEYSLDEDGWPYTSKDISYYEDGSKVVCEYDAEYETISEIWYNADGSMMDNSHKFDVEVCKDLIGTWKAEMDIADFIMEVEELDYSFRIMVTMILTDKGEISITMEIDENEVRDFMYQMTLESIYASFEEEGLSKTQADAAFEALMGMTIAEYVESMLDETDINDLLLGEIPEGFTGVYYVEDGVIYAGDSWNQPLEGPAYTLAGDTLTLETDDEEYAGMELVFTKVTE